MDQSIKNSFIALFFVLFMFSQISPAIITQQVTINEEQNNTTTSITSPQSIQAQIDAANSYDTIIIAEGTYYEHITINKPLTLIGEKNTIMDGSHQKHILTIQADDVTIYDIQFQHTGGKSNHNGILARGKNITIQNCVFYHARQGIHLQNSSNVHITSCTFQHIGIGINTNQSQQIWIMNCSFSHTAIGIMLEKTSTTIIDDVYLDTNGISIYLLQSDNVTINESIIRDNSDNHGGIFSSKSTSILITNCLIHHNGIGINVEHTTHLTLTHCLITNNTHFGILIRPGSKNIVIKENSIKHNLRFGIYCYEDTSVSIQRNNIEDNDLYSLYSTQPVDDLKYNWWGSSNGPCLSAVNTHQRITLNNYLSHFSTWATTPYQYSYNFSMNHRPSPSPKTIETPSITQYITGMDSDQDGAPDWWEEKWGYSPGIYQPHHDIDEDEDGLTNIEECYTDQWDSNPFKKDIFLEIDWIETTSNLNTNKPSNLLLDQMQHHFATQNITLHIDDGRLGHGGRIPAHKSTDFSDMIHIYWTHFLDNNPLHPRKGIFHYAIISDQCADVSYPFIGWDQFDSIAISAAQAKQLSPQYPRQMIIVGGILHQLGSTLGLLVETHPGNDNLNTAHIGSIDWFIYRDYKSSMNYLYKYRILSFSDGSSGKGDFNDWDNLDFSFFKNTSFQT